MRAITRKLTLAFLDTLFITTALIFSFFLKFDTQWPYYPSGQWATILISLLFVSLTVNYFFNLYKSLWRYASVDEFLYIIGAGIISVMGFFLLLHIIQIQLSLSIYFLIFLFNTVFLGTSRLGYRVIRRLKNHCALDKSSVKKVLIIGAGAAGAMVIKELKMHPELGLKPVLIVDDDKTKHNTRVMGVPVSGDRERIVALTKQLGIDEIIFAIPSAPKGVAREILNECKKTSCKLKTLPGMYELIDEKVSIQQIRDVQIEDLLGREPIKVDLDGICDYICNQVVLITGGGGSIGSELCRQITRFSPKKLVILDIYENTTYDLQQEMLRNHPELDLEVLIGSVRDKPRLESIFSTYKPAVVFHAAAHKHVPLMEHNPSEAIKNNVFGTLNTAECAEKYGVKRFVLISTDKAVNPTNIMGATKRIAEMIIQAMDRKSKTEYVAVRFGNVLGSNGSVIPLFKKQIAEGGPVTVTHPEINRFFMTIPEAVELVLQAGSMAKGGEIFVLDMGQPVKIADLAKDLIRLSGFEPDVDMMLEYSGLRPGEKLYEELLMDEEGLAGTKHKKIFIGSPIHIEINTLRKELEKLKFVMLGPNEDLIAYVKDLVPTYSLPVAEIAAAARDVE